MHYRKERIESLLQQEIAIIVSQKVSDPRVIGANIISVSISPDLQLAKVYYSCIYDECDIKSLQAGLDHAKSFIRNELKKVIYLKKLPQLAFIYDPSIKKGDRVLDLIRKLPQSSDSTNDQTFNSTDNKITNSTS